MTFGARLRWLTLCLLEQDEVKWDNFSTMSCLPRVKRGCVCALCPLKPGREICVEGSAIGLRWRTETWWPGVWNPDLCHLGEPAGRSCPSHLRLGLGFWMCGSISPCSSYFLLLPGHFLQFNTMAISVPLKRQRCSAFYNSVMCAASPHDCWRNMVRDSSSLWKKLCGAVPGIGIYRPLFSYLIGTRMELGNIPTFSCG